MSGNNLSAVFVDAPKPVETRDLVKRIFEYTGDKESFKNDFTDMIITQNLGIGRLSAIDIRKCACSSDDIEFHFNCKDDVGDFYIIYILTDVEFESFEVIGGYFSELVNKLDKQDRVVLL